MVGPKKIDVCSKINLPNENHCTYFMDYSASKSGHDFRKIFKTCAHNTVTQNCKKIRKILMALEISWFHLQSR